MIAAPAEMAASRAQAPVASILRQAITSFRQSAKMVEAPTTALPAYVKPQAADWGRIVRARAGVAAVYFPALGTFLSWPFIAQSVLDGHMGQL
ncbi:hypothetical protein F5B20DRAFT_124709 [Whalleya microplaca]|nr:hypothetical protein F5B20DRAFT_124709 [Whalleya microplaca]